MSPRILRPCGTEAAYYRHLANDEEPCRPCRDAHNERSAERRLARGVTSSIRPAQPCGTDAGYQRHQRASEAPCDPCTEAHREKNQRLKPCGTTAAAQRHKRRGEPLCDPCRGAVNAANQKHQTARRRREGMKPQQIAPCGTKSARVRHRRRGEQCDTCATAKQQAITAGRERAAETRAAAVKPKTKPKARKKQGGGGPDGLTLTWTITPTPHHIARAAALRVAAHVPRDDIADVLDTLGISDTLRGAA